MNVDLGIWSKLTKVVIGLVVLAVLLLIGMCYLPVIHENERMRRQIMIFQDQIQKEEARSKELQAQVDALLHDPKTVERLTRENSVTPSRMKPSCVLNRRRRMRWRDKIAIPLSLESNQRIK